MTNKAIGWIKQQKALMADKPFFIYFAPGATHAPHHVPKEWADKYKGKFDKGWDAVRAETFERQKKLGVIPKDAVLTARPEEIPGVRRHARRSSNPSCAREMEVYAGFLEHTDHHIGRLFDALEELEIAEDTLIYYIFGDNGASAEGTLQGCFNEVAVLNGMASIETPEFLMSKIDEFGGPEAYNHYAVGWAHAMNTPYQWTKQVASHLGGTRNGTIVHWPKGIKAKGEIRSQFCHVIDIAPTVLEAAEHSAAGLRERHSAGAVRRREHVVRVQRREGRRAPRDAVLRDVLQPRHLSQGLDRGHPAWRSMAGFVQAHVRRRCLGVVRHEHRLDAVEESREGESEETRGAQAVVPHRGDEVQRAAAR